MGGNRRRLDAEGGAVIVCARSGCFAPSRTDSLGLCDEHAAEEE